MKTAATLLKKFQGNQPDPLAQFSKLSGPPGLKALIEDVRLELIKTHGELFLKNINENMPRIKEAIREQLTKIFPDVDVTLEEDIIAHMVGLGPIEKLRNRQGISEIMINGPEDVWIDINGILTKTDVKFDSDKDVRDLLDRVALRCGRKINMSKPILDARYENLRVNGVIPPRSKNTLITIRVKNEEDVLTETELLENGTFISDIATFINFAVRARLNIIVCGPAGSGKTVLIRILGGYIPHDERIVTIEDVYELGLELIHPHVVALEAGAKDEAGSINDLTINALRMRPERIIIGEIRGAEAIELLRAMGTGHEGSLTSLHSNFGKQEMVSRLIGSMSEGTGIPVDDLKRMLGETVDLTIFIKKYKDGTRRLHISEVTNDNEERQPDFNDIYRYNFEKGAYEFVQPLTSGLLWKIRDNLMGRELPEIPPFKERRA
ncbi:MAG: CpaF family protein [Bacillota bacterium]